MANTDSLQQNISTYKYITRKWERITVALRPKACLFGRSLAEIAGSNTAEKYAYISVVRVNYQLDANICLF